MPLEAAAASQPVIATGLGLREATERFQRQWIEEALRRHDGAMAAAAREAGMDRSNFLRLLKRLGVNAPSR
jgi:anaerobic nitric oxide reductase transcription regulator